MDKEVRNLIQRATQDARRLLEREYQEQLEGTFDILVDGSIAAKPGPHLDAAQKLVRQKLVAAVEHKQAGDMKPAEAVAAYLREKAFTTLNRFAALKMLEARKLVQECVSKGEQSAGFREFQGLAPGLAALSDHGYRIYLESLFDEIGREVRVLFDRQDPASLLWPRRQAFLDLLEILNRPDLQAIWTEDETIGWIYQYFNSDDDRQKARYDSAGKPKAPQNSHELAVRNQFFTPRYVVEFLTDNTLGRIWYEMRRGRTSLKEKCRYIVRRPYEIFLGGGYLTEGLPGYANIARVLAGDISQLPEDADWDTVESLALCIAGYEYFDGDDLFRLFSRREEEYKGTGRWQGNAQDLWLCLFAEQRRWHDSGPPEGDDLQQIQALYKALRAELQKDTSDLSQEELLREPVVVPYRKPKDPRELKILDPACGSGHFLLYCFDLLLTIYEEAWNDSSMFGSDDSGQKLREDYPTIEALRAALPGLILQHNLNGIDIDSRCAQIAAFSLWMRAQKAYNDIGIERADRSVIRKTNVVVAEPMPGEKDMLREFTATLEPKVLGQLVEVAFTKMQLAGETGSLLKMEEELTNAVATAKQQWSRGPSYEQMHVFPEEQRSRARQLQFDVSGLTDARFWGQAELLVVNALRQYAAQGSNGHGFRRKLFAEDAEQGFAFIDMCRQQYDVVLMNPPFGEASAASRCYLYDAIPECARDLFAGFVSRFCSLLTPSGRLGALTNRTAFFSDFLAPWRERNFMGGITSLSVMSDLGYGVLDAVVETAAYVCERTSSRWSMYIQTLSQLDKQSSLSQLVCDVASGRSAASVYVRCTRDFARIPKSRFMYHLHPAWLAIFCANGEHPMYVSRAGLTTGDDPRFLRCFWEVAEPVSGQRWRWLAKGGDFGRYRTDIHLLVDWSAADLLSRTRNSELYGRAGITYTERTTSNLSARVLNRSSCFSGPGPGIIPHDERDLHLVLAFMNSFVAAYCLEAMIGGGDFSVKGSAARHLEPGYVNYLPACEPSSNDRVWFASRMEELVRLLDVLDEDEAHPLFAGVPVWPDSSLVDGLTRITRDRFGVLCKAYQILRDTERRITSLLRLPDERVQEAFGETGWPWPERTITSGADVLRFAAVDPLVPEQVHPEIAGRHVRYRFENKLSHYLHAGIEGIARKMNIAPEALCADLEQCATPSQDALRRYAANVLSLIMGCLFGRWSMTALRSVPVHVTSGQIFDALPGVPSVHSLSPVGVGSVGVTYAVLVDDPGHEQDIIERIRSVLHAIWSDRSPEVYGEIIGVLAGQDGNLRSWFRKTFLDTHIRRYTKSHRKAPIYWELSVPSHSYAVWLYYHRITKDSIYRVLHDVVAPKVQHETRVLARLRQEAGPNPTNSQRKGIDEQEAIVAELATFQEEIERVAPLWNPDLNDGVIVNIAPLWRLVPQNRAWQKECKECWDRLVAEEHDWSNLAMHLWPERVVPKCATDRSLAIAHGLEEIFWYQDEDDENWYPRDVPKAQVEALVKERTSASVKAALNSLLTAPSPQGNSKRGGRKNGR